MILGCLIFATPRNPAIRALSSDDELIRFRALQTLAKEGGPNDEAAIPNLIDCLSDEHRAKMDWSFTEYAIQALACIDLSDDRVLDVLLSIDPPFGSRAEMLLYAALSRIGPRDPRSINKCIEFVRRYPSLFEPRIAWRGPTQTFHQVEGFFGKLGPEHSYAALDFVSLIRELPHEAGAVSVASNALFRIGAVDEVSEADVAILLQYVNSDRLGVAPLLSKLEGFAPTILSIALKALDHYEQPQQMQDTLIALGFIKALGPAAPDIVTPRLEEILHAIDATTSPLQRQFAEALLRIDPKSSSAIESLTAYLKESHERAGHESDHLHVNSLLATAGYEVEANMAILGEALAAWETEPLQAAQSAALILKHRDADPELRRMAIQQIIRVHSGDSPDPMAAVVSANGLLFLLPSEQDWETEIRRCISELRRRESEERASHQFRLETEGMLESSIHIRTLVSALAALPELSSESKALLLELRNGSDYRLSRAAYVRARS